MITDSAGPGRHRGGLRGAAGGRVPRARPDRHDGDLAHPRGLARRQRRRPRVAPDAAAQDGRRPIETVGGLDEDGTWLPQMLGNVAFKPGEAFVFESGGGGGWGDPLERDPARVAEDVRNEIVSREQAADGLRRRPHRRAGGGSRGQQEQRASVLEHRRRVQTRAARAAVHRDHAPGRRGQSDVSQGVVDRIEVAVAEDVSTPRARFGRRAGIAAAGTRRALWGSARRSGVPDADRHADRLELEAPRTRHGDAIVDPPVDTAGVGDTHPLQIVALATARLQCTQV